MAGLAIIGAFIARMLRPRRVRLLGIVALTGAVWLVLAGVIMAVGAGLVPSSWGATLIATLLATLGFVPFARLERAP
jgi:hypothetical protein